MRILHRLLASHGVGTSPASSILTKPPTLALLPPIPLYRRLLRIHRRKLSAEERLLGDEYVKSEFRLHRDIENPLHIVGFLSRWQWYAQSVEGDTWQGGKMDPGELDKMSDQQIGQLYELMQAIKKQQKDGEGGGDGGDTPPPAAA